MIATRFLFVLTEHFACMLNAPLWVGGSYRNNKKRKSAGGANPFVLWKCSILYMFWSQCGGESIFDVYMDDLIFVHQ